MCGPGLVAEWHTSLTPIQPGRCSFDPGESVWGDGGRTTNPRVIKVLRPATAARRDHLTACVLICTIEAHIPRQTCEYRYMASPVCSKTSGRRTLAPGRSPREEGCRAHF